ncbi:hypothetical protein M3Y97_00197700 [Aphelenchoides bicaudatus]|nr:hypothetical protein M3Y97_00197700 [Aphelenchoides bicaudatus]
MDLTTPIHLYLPLETLSSTIKENCITTERVGTQRNIGLITLNRPKSLNAFSLQQFAELSKALSDFENDSTINAIILTGAGNAFSAGMDLKEGLGHQGKTALGQSNDDLINLPKIQKPVIAAVNGIAFGAGCEVAMMCDIIWASNKAQFGQPEIKVGLVPGLGGTQRLTRRINKPLAMELCLTGRKMTADEAKHCGLIARVLPHESLLIETIKLAEEIGKHSPIVVRLIKESVNRSQEVSLSEGLLFEKRVHEAGLALSDAKEGMEAFVQKRKPNWSKL